MRTLLLINKLGDVQIYCPFCKIMAYRIEEDDYVGCNCLFWCDNCNEVMICPTGLNYKKNGQCEIDMLLEGIIIDDCTKLLDQNSEMDTINGYGYDIPNDLDKYYCFSVAILLIQQISQKPFTEKLIECAPDDYEYDKDEPINTVNVYRFEDIPTDVDASHDGNYLFYKAKCTECEKSYESYIWGD